MSASFGVRSLLMIYLADDLYLDWVEKVGGSVYLCCFLKNKEGVQIIFNAGGRGREHATGIKLALKRGLIEYGSGYYEGKEQIYGYKLTLFGKALLKLTQ